MPITNNLIQIAGKALRPAPKFNISYETFKSGNYVIGGVLKISINGEIYASDQGGLIDKINEISAYAGTCQNVVISCGEETLVDAQGFIANITINPNGEQLYSVTYTLDIEISNINGISHITRDSDFDTLLGITLPANINLKSYEESLSIVGDDSMSNSAFYDGSTYTKAQLKLSGSLSIEGYHHMCDNNGDVIEELYSVLDARFNKILTLEGSIATAYPSIASYCNGSYNTIHDNKNFTINKIDNKASLQFDMYIIPILPNTAYPKSIVDLTVAENTDQTTGLSTLSVRGSVKGLSDRTSSILDNKILYAEKLNNARNALSSIVDNLENRNYAHFKVNGCAFQDNVFITADGASPPTDICYNRISSQITENLHGGEINFELSYGDIQFCQLGGANIDVNITEDFPTLKYVEHIIPGIEYPVIQIGTSQNAMKITITVSGKLNGCDTTRIGNLIDCVENRLITERTNRGYATYLLQNRNTTTGKYSYKVVESYIGFDALSY